jgi:hypothetical protein
LEPTRADWTVIQPLTQRFKLGETVNNSPASRAQSVARGIYSVTGLLPEHDGQPNYRIKHFAEDYERVAQESELSAV